MTDILFFPHFFSLLLSRFPSLPLFSFPHAFPLTLTLFLPTLPLSIAFPSTFCFSISSHTLFLALPLLSVLLTSSLAFSLLRFFLYPPSTPPLLLKQGRSCHYNHDTLDFISVSQCTYVEWLSSICHVKTRHLSR